MPRDRFGLIRVVVEVGEVVVGRCWTRFVRTVVRVILLVDVRLLFEIGRLVVVVVVAFDYNLDF